MPEVKPASGEALRILVVEDECDRPRARMPPGGSRPCQRRRRGRFGGGHRPRPEHGAGRGSGRHPPDRRTDRVEVARALSADPRTTVVFMTANAKRIPPDFAGAVGVIAKPIPSAPWRAPWTTVRPLPLRPRPVDGDARRVLSGAGDRRVDRPGDRARPSRFTSTRGDSPRSGGVGDGSNVPTEAVSLGRPRPRRLQPVERIERLPRVRLSGSMVRGDAPACPSGSGAAGSGGGRSDLAEAREERQIVDPGAGRSLALGGFQALEDRAGPRHDARRTSSERAT